MKHFKKLNTKGFAHWIIPALVVVVIGSIGTYLLTRSHADSTSDATQVCGSGFKKITAIQLHDTKGVDVPGLAELYANASTKKVCAFTYSTGVAYGKAKPMAINVEIWQHNTAVHPTVFDFDKGTYKVLAGPTTLSAASYANGKYEVYFKGSMVYGGRTGTADGSYLINSNFTFTRLVGPVH